MPILHELWHWSQQQEALPQSSLRKAILYMQSLWPGLVRFAQDGRLPLDNNAIERDLRGVVRWGSFCTTPSGFCHHKNLLLLRRRDTTVLGTNLSVA